MKCQDTRDAHCQDRVLERNLLPAYSKTSASGRPSALHCSTKAINSYCFNMQFKDSVENPLFCPMETCPKELGEKTLPKFPKSNCCIWSSPSDMAPIYAVEIAKLWIQQQCKNTSVSAGRKMVNVKQRNDQRMKDIAEITSGEKIQCQQVKDIGVMKAGEKVTQCQQIKDIGVMTSGEKVAQCQQIKDIGVMKSGEKVTQCRQIKDIGVMTSGENVAQCQQIMDIGVMTSVELVQGRLSKDNQCQQIKDIGVMTSGEKVTHCRDSSDIGVMTLGEKVTQCQQIKDIGVMTSVEEVVQCQLSKGKQCQQIRDIGVMTSGEKVTHCRDSIDIGVMTLGENVTQCQQIKDTGVVASGEKITQCQHKSLSDELASCRILTVDGPGDYGASPLFVQFAKYSKSHHIFKPKGVTQAVQETPGSNKHNTTKENVNCLVPVSCPLEGREREIMKETNICSTTTSGKKEKVDGSEMGNSCAFRCKDFSESEPMILNNTVNKHFFHEINSSDKKCLIKNKTALFPNEKTDKWCDNSHPLICNVMHELPLEASDRSSYSKLLLSERGLLNEKVDRKLCVPELHQAINGQDVTRKSVNYGISLRKTVSAEQFHLGWETKDQYQIPCYNVHQTKKNHGLQGNHKTHIKANKSNFYPHTDVSENITPIVHCNRDSEITKSNTKMNTLGPKGNSLEFPTMGHNFSYNPKAKNLGPWLQEMSQKTGSNSCDTKLRKKSNEIADTIQVGHLENEFQSESHVCDQRGISSLQFRKGNKNSDEDITTNGFRITFANITANEEPTKKFAKKRSIWSFFQNLLRKLDPSRKRERKRQDNESPTFVTLNYKRHNKRKSKRQAIHRDTYGFEEKCHTTSSSGYDNEHVSSNANKQIYDSTRSEANKCYRHSHTHKKRQAAVNLLKDCKHDENVLNGNVTIPVLFRDETSLLKSEECNKNVVVMVAAVHSSSGEVNRDIMEELKQQRQDIDSLKQLLNNNENKTHNKNHSKNKIKDIPLRISGTTTEFGIPMVPELNKSITNFQNVSNTQGVFKVKEQPISEHLLNEKCKSISLHDYFAFNSMRYKNGGQVPALTVKRTPYNFSNDHSDISHECTNGCMWRNSTKHGHRRAEKHLRYVIRHCRNGKTDLWNKILSLCRYN
ncbi:uncharacterized protein LOC126334851 [Schistocerca gregaria]|uniref:uncharacterized protein LOC126334851 n=1 Tax=Schistocerca gregaria TaxID=7010 RepID=UPI00211F459C|nr:uncharacterized protein LOC126334851 [Schistocerca gregaria]